MTLISILISGVAHSQDKTKDKSQKSETENAVLHTLKIKMPEMTMTGLDKLKVGDNYRVQVEGVNLNLYKIQLNTEEVFKTEALVFPSFSGVDVAGLDKLLAGMKTSLPKSPDGEGASDTNHGNKVVVGTDANETTKKLARAAIDEASDSLRTLLITMKELNIKIQEWYFDAQLARIAYMRLNRNNDTTLHREYDFACMSRDGGLLRQQANELQDTLKLLAKEYAAKNNAKSLLSLPSTDPLLKEHAKMNENLDKAMTEVGELAMATTNDKASQMLNGLLDLDNASAVEYVSIPRRYEGGDVFMDLKIDPIEEKSHLPSYSTGEFRWPTRSQPYFAVGPSFYVADLYDQDVSVGSRSFGDSTVYSLSNEPRSDREFGAALQFVGGLQVGGDLGIHASIGPGLSFSDPIRPRLLYGLGLSYGREHRIVLDVGGIYGAVPRRKQSFSMDDGYATEPQEVTTNRVVGGGYFSVGYIYMIRPSTKKKDEVLAPEKPSSVKSDDKTKSSLGSDAKNESTKED